ncbi:MAG: hypothetical protein WC998_08225, partial [Candidatus Paceibacterota bacterium]
NINDTEGLPSRASPWAPVSGVTIDPANNDLWTVAAGASAPAVSRSWLTRKWLRLDRLSGGYTPGLQYHVDWPIMSKANLPIATTGDDPAWWSAATGGVDSEDIYDWSNYRYILLGLTAARAGTVRLTVSYSVPAPSDPCYVGASWRYEEFSYTSTSYTLTYDIAVTAGAGTYLVDLTLNREGQSIDKEYSLKVVDSVALSLPANPSGSDEQYELTGLSIVLDPGETGRAEPSSHILMRYKPAWDWSSNWFGFGAVIDGKPALQYDYGYDSPWGYTRKEVGPLYIRRSEHNPDYEGEASRLDAAKALNDLRTELAVQEGITATWPTPTPENSANNKDADDAQVDSALYWWDLLQSSEGLNTANCEVALCAGTYNNVAGCAYNIRFYKYPRGALHGLALNGAGTAVKRSETDLIDVYEALDGGAYAKVDTIDTDEHGRYRYDAAREHDALYMLDGGGALLTALSVAHREYTSNPLPCEQYTPVHPCIAEGYINDLHLAFVSTSTIHYRRKPTVKMPWEVATSVVNGDYPCLSVLPTGELIMAYQTSGTAAWRRSQDHGKTWEAIGVATSGLYPMACEYNGIQYLVTYTSTVGQVLRRSQDYFSTLLTYGAATSALIVPATSCNAERVSFLKMDSGGRILWTAIPNGNRVVHKGSYNDGETWVAL